MNRGIKPNGIRLKLIKPYPCPSDAYVKWEYISQAGDIYLECNDGWFHNPKRRSWKNVRAIESWEEYFEEVQESFIDKMEKYMIAIDPYLTSIQVCLMQSQKVKVDPDGNVEYVKNQDALNKVKEYENKINEIKNQFFGPEKEKPKAVAFQNGNRFKIRNDNSGAIYVFRKMVFSDGVGCIHCEVDGRLAVLANIELLDLIRVA